MAIESSTTTTSICSESSCANSAKNFLPLRVIRDRLESGAIEDPTGPTTPPRGIRNLQSAEGSDDDSVLEDRDRGLVTTDTPMPTQQHAIIADVAAPPTPSVAVRAADPASRSTGGGAADSTSQVHRSDSYSAADLCHLAELTEPQLAELESYGLLNGKGSGAATMYTACDVAIAQAAARFMQHGVGGRHLKAWRQAAEREASLFEQMILPLLRQRNPQARQQAVDTLSSLAALGGELRSAIVHSALSHHLDG